MPRVLLAWEFGGDLGHVRRAAAIARQLRDRGHEPLLAFADPGPLGTAAIPGIAWVQAPLLARPARPDLAPINASDILLNLGFCDAAGLAGALRAWSSLFRLWQPRALVADYAPTALLAARAAGLRRLAIGSGFSTPPTAEPMPALRPWIPADPARLAHRDAQLVEAVRDALGHAAPRAPAPRRAAEIFAADAHLVCTWPQFDPFGPREGVEYLGPQDDGVAARPVEWVTDRRPRMFAYLKPRDPRFAAIAAALASVAGEAIVAAPGIGAREAASLSGSGMRVFDEPVALASLLAKSDLCASHAGPGIVAAAAAYGVPQALLPLQLEQYLVARRLCETGAACMLEPDTPAPDLATWLHGASSEAARIAAGAQRAEASRPAISASGRIARALEG